MALTSDNFNTFSKDMPTAIRDYLNTLYGRTDTDVAFLIQKYLNDQSIHGTGAPELANRWKALESAAILGTS